jgi:hypothetical protein
MQYALTLMLSCSVDVMPLSCLCLGANSLPRKYCTTSSRQSLQSSSSSIWLSPRPQPGALGLFIEQHVDSISSVKSGIAQLHCAGSLADGIAKQGLFCHIQLFQNAATVIANVFTW